MTWNELLATGAIVREPTSRDEIRELIQLARVFLGDAGLEGLSDEGRFDRAYGAARTLSVLVIRSQGVRVKSIAGSHRATFLALAAADPMTFSSMATYFDRCRSTRNVLNYEHSGVISPEDVIELLARVDEFAKLVHAWLLERHPELE